MCIRLEGGNCCGRKVRIEQARGDQECEEIMTLIRSVNFIEKVMLELILEGGHELAMWI